MSKTRVLAATPGTVSALRNAARIPTRNLLPPSSPRRPIAAPNIAGGTGAYPCLIKNAVGAGYNVDVYKNGKDQPKTGTGEIQILQLHISAAIPSGTWIMGFDTTLINYNDEI